MWVFSHFFRNVHATKPAASRNESAEIFVVCLGYKAPEKIDPKFLDPRSVFSEVEPIESSKKDELINPERKKKAPAEGYETGQTLLYNKVPFIYYVGICVNSTPLKFYELIFLKNWPKKKKKYYYTLTKVHAVASKSLVPT